jgi:hypothetical protein
VTTAPVAYLEQLRKSYGDPDAPRRDFALAAADREPFARVRSDLSAIGPVLDDTDVNDDVCFTYIVGQQPPLVVKLSMVGPYAVVLSSRGELLTHPVLAGVLRKHGFILPSRDILESMVPISFPGRSEPATLYAALFEPEGSLV